MDRLREELECFGFDDEDDWCHEDEEHGHQQHDDHEQQLQQPRGASASPDGPGADDGPDDLTCAICLGQIAPLDLALVKGCEHQYCVHCILQWAMLKEWCPQCKAPFTYLLSHRHLDGAPCDYPLEEPVALLKRARWFVDEHEARERARGEASEAAARRVTADDAAELAHAAARDADAPPSPRDWCDYYEDIIDEELEEDEAIEDYYYSAAAGRARIVLGNRRWGGGGYMRNGRMYARPTGAAAAGPSGSGASGSGAAPAPAPAAAYSSGKGGKGKAAAPAPAAGPAGAHGGGAAAHNDKGKAPAPAPRKAPTPPPPAPPPAAPPPAPAPAPAPRKVSKAAAAREAWSYESTAPALAASPLGRSPGSFSGGGSCWMAAAGAALGTSPGSAPGSGRRAKRNARRAAVDAGVADAAWA